MGCENYNLKKTPFSFAWKSWNSNIKLRPKLISSAYSTNNTKKSEKSNNLKIGDDRSHHSMSIPKIKFQKLHLLSKGPNLFNQLTNGVKSNSCDNNVDNTKKGFKFGIMFSKVNGKVRLLSKPERLHGNKCVRCPRGKPRRPILNISGAKIIETRSKCGGGMLG